MRKYIAPIMAAIAAIAVFAGCASSPVHAASVSTTKLGLFQTDNNADYSLAGHQPAYAIEYYGWQEGFRAPAAGSKSEEFAELQSNPGGDQAGVSLADITAGKYDAYLTSYAESVKAYGHPILITFDHEMNGNWYPWGYQAATPKQWIAAWDHVRKVMNAVASKYLTWVWAPNVNTNSQYPMQAYWPGVGHANVMGIDGYYWSASSTWANSGLAAAYTELHKLAPGKPFLIAETGVPAESGAGPQLRNLVANAKADHAMGICYFDSKQWVLIPYRASLLVSLLGG